MMAGRGSSAAPGYPLRLAVNIGNAATVREGSDGLLSGPCIDVADALSNFLGRPLVITRFASARDVLEALEGPTPWDAAFLAADPARSTKLHFSKPYLAIEATYAVRSGSLIRYPEECDAPGVVIASSRGAAYDLELQRSLKNARLAQFDSPAASLAAFRTGQFDAVAGIRPALDGAFGNDLGVRILAGGFMQIAHAIAIPHANDVLVAEIDRFMDHWAVSNR